MASNNGKLLIIGFGPGAFEHITERARQAIAESEVIIGYNTYVDLIRGLLTDQEIVRTGMTEEVSRAQEAIRQAEMGKKVAVISSGDSGVYGMAGLVYEVLIEKKWNPATGVEVEVIPGISAINSCASLLGAPVMHDACTISLSDHLTPWEQIAKRVEAAASADFIIALYNPRSGRRTRQIVETQRILLKYRSPDTPVGLVKSAYRDREQVIVTTLGAMLEHDIGMLTTVIIGNSTTFFYEGLIITPRGYKRKYTLDTTVQALRPHERLRTEAEPWSLNAQEEDWESEEETSEQQYEQAAAVAVAVEPEPRTVLHPASLALEALERLTEKGIVSGGKLLSASQPAHVARTTTSIFELAVSPGIANKKFSALQMMQIAELVGESGEIEYTPHHQIIIRVETEDPSSVVSWLKAENLLVFPIGDVAQVKACDFCNLEKDEAIPVAEQLNRTVGGLKTPKELKIGINGCGMACYGAVLEDIGIVYRRGAYDLFLGGKTIGRNAHAAQPVAEGISAEEIVPVMERIFKEYTEKGHPNERFHKFFKRVGQVAGFTYQDVHAPVEVDAACGD
ncbi:precorrin-3B C(17)-methyltransferase [Paenibacillus sp. MMS18-CY102]|uniref:precorrin-3B C(17)-methyltransferase n=1 Tax=Paenibacillus sp. MMS18-CY102 TaxID=2682849 RepID=UPI001365572D|nr:precorrin-3B C(17)-methyltransferase [Paenibacillus sp. MMS18-CY102]MWC30624.1 precorrin-3B C(17)-methyltransferase [Paenibacillus sp. MMS18-CY102]